MKRKKSMSRNIMSASSTSSAYFLGSRSADNNSEFNIWNLLSRRTLENAFCMTSKFRVRAKIHRIKTTTVQRQRRHVDNVKALHKEESSSSSSDVSQDWNDFDEDEDDLVELYTTLTSKPTLSAAAGAIVTMSKSYNINRPFSGIETDVVANIAESGTRAQKLYLKRCADFLITPSKVFLKELPTVVIDIGHQNIGPKGAQACAIALSQTKSVRVVNLNDNAIGTRGAKYIALLLKENANIRDLNLSDNNLGSRGAKYLVNVIMELDHIERLDLSNNGFKEKDAILFKLLLEETRNLRYLNLSYNMFREEGGQVLGGAISYNDGLEELDLTWNHLRREGATGLAEGLMDNTSLRKLNVSWNGFYLEGCIGFQKTLFYNTTLEVLDLTNNRINRECLEQLTYGLARNTTLHTLILKFNPLTSEGANDILQFLVDCPTSGIKLLDLGIQQVDQNCLAMINEVHLQGRELKVIHGHVTGQLKSKSPELEKSLIEEHPSLVLIEFGKLMGFRLVDLFSSLDKDGSRTLDKEEIHKGLKLANVPFSDACIDILIEKLDTDGDGEIDFSELLVAQQKHREASMKLLEAEQSEGRIQFEDVPLWRIRTRLMKLMAERMSDYASFKRLSDGIARQVQRKNEEIEARREAITKQRARRPRKVKSRPASSTQQKPVSGQQSPAESPTNLNIEESDEENKQLDDKHDDIDIEKVVEKTHEDEKSEVVDQSPEFQQTFPGKKNGTKAGISGRLRKQSIQLPIRGFDHAALEGRRNITFESDTDKSSSASSSKKNEQFM